MFNFFEYIRENYIKLIGIVIIIIAIVFGYFMFGMDDGEIDNVAIIPRDDANVIEEENEIKKVFVDIKGFIKKPGVYEIDSNKRINDVIQLAGGIIANADTSVINLAKMVYDEMVIVIYSKDEVKKFEEIKAKEIVKETQCKVVNNVISNNACVNSNDKNTGNNSGSNNPSNNSDGKISLNTATKEELMTLSGVGEAKAELILEYRNVNGGFKDIEELKNISGIGEATFEKLKDYIKI